MLLTGTFKRSIDEKYRIAIPKRLREQFSSGESKSEALFVAPGTDGSLALYTEESFSRLADKLGSASPTGQDVRAFSRLFYSQAERVEMDGQGRIRIPAELAQLANLGREAVLVGVRDHLELWNTDSWSSYIVKQQEQYDDLAERAFAAEQTKQ